VGTYRRSSSEEEQSGRFLAQRWYVPSTVLVPGIIALSSPCLGCTR
jgi:hypothetical protein